MQPHVPLFKPGTAEKRHKSIALQSARLVSNTVVFFASLYPAL